MLIVGYIGITEILDSFRYLLNDSMDLLGLPSFVISRLPGEVLKYWFTRYYQWLDDTLCIYGLATNTMPHRALKKDRSTHNLSSRFLRGRQASFRG